MSTFQDFLENVDKQEFDKFVDEIIENRIDDIDEYFYIDDDDTNYNHNLYENIKEGYTLYDYLVEMDPESFGRDLENEFEDAKLEYSNDFHDYVCNHSGKFEDKFNKTLQRFIVKNDKAPGFNSKNDEFIFDDDENYADFTADNKIDNVYRLSKINDKIGDSFEIIEDVDYLSRDYAFMYLDGDILQGDAGETHSQIVNHYLRDMGKDTISDDYDEKKDFSRPSLRQIKHFTDAEHVGFGHILNDVGFIETIKNCSVEDVKNALQDEYDLKKIYMYIRNFNGDYVQRIAKRLKASSIEKS